MKRGAFGVLSMVLAVCLIVPVAGCKRAEPEDETATESTAEATPAEETPEPTDDTGEPVPTEDELLALLEESVQTWTEDLMTGAGAPYEVTAQITQDATGAWWGVAGAQPTPGDGNAYESITFWCSYNGLQWTGQAQDPEPPAPDTYFPADVVEVLF